MDVDKVLTTFALVAGAFAAITSGMKNIQDLSQRRKKKKRRTPAKKKRRQ